jgi:hypothetical protein
MKLKEELPIRIGLSNARNGTVTHEVIKDRVVKC